VVNFLLFFLQQICVLWENQPKLCSILQNLRKNLKCLKIKPKNHTSYKRE